MIAMQYSFTLPADYDMEIIERRIRDKGHMTDGFPHLRFKAYLSAHKQTIEPASTENLYAPFYLWDEAEGATGFLSNSGFSALTNSFGWPSVQTWLPLAIELQDTLCESRFASREITPIAPYTDLADLRAEVAQKIAIAKDNGALAAVAGFDPASWKRVLFYLWADMPKKQNAATQIYTVGHISQPKI